MAAALRELGYSVNDFPEHLHGGLFLSIQLGFEEIKNDLKLFSSGLSTYLAFLDGKVPVEALVPLYKDVDAVTDQPTCHLWPILLQLFPDAKVTLWFGCLNGLLVDRPGDSDGTRKC